jgi:ABC-type glycerol-3-phosphate transport system permease component
MARTTAKLQAEAFKHAVVWAVLASAFLPLYLMIVISFKSNEQFANNRWFFDAPSEWQLSNWTAGWNQVKDQLANSIVTSVGGVLACLLLAIPTSYVIARYRFPGRELLYYAMLLTMFLPGGAAALVTTFTLMHSLGLVNSLFGIIVLGGVGGQVTCIFILRQFIEDIPKELFESAQIDGAGHLRQMTTIVLPLSGPIIGTLAIMQFIGNWNNLMLPLLLLRDKELLTVPVVLMHLDGEYVKEYGKLMAGYAISAIPLIVLFLFTMRMFVKGLTAGAVKG